MIIGKQTIMPSFAFMKRFILLLSLIIASNHGFAQKKLIQKFLSNQKDTTRSPSFMPVPVLGYTQEIGIEVGLGALYSAYIDRKDTLNRSSNFSGTASYSTKKTYNISLKADVWTKGNRYHILSEIKLKKTPFNFYGTGNKTAQKDEDRLVQNLAKLAIDFEKSFLKSTYTGIYLGYEHYTFTDKIADGIFAQPLRFNDADGGQVLYLGLSQSLDTRNSNNYPTKGFFGRISYLFAPNLFGQPNFKGQFIKINLRKFTSLSPQVVLGMQAVLNHIDGPHIPFYLLPQLGNDELMRGYYNGRYRDENMSAAQVELRYRFSNRFGLAAFAGTGKVFPNSAFNLRELKPNYGFGGRYFFDPAKGLSVRFDYGIGEKRSGEDRQKGFYISLAEAF